MVSLADDELKNVRHSGVPGFLGFGPVDLAKNPLAEYQRFTAIKDVTVHIQERTHHCDHLGPARHELSATSFTWIWGRAKDSAKK